MAFGRPARKAPFSALHWRVAGSCTLGRAPSLLRSIWRPVVRAEGQLTGATLYSRCRPRPVVGEGQVSGEGARLRRRTAPAAVDGPPESCDGQELCRKCTDRPSAALLPARVNGSNMTYFAYADGKALGGNGEAGACLGKQVDWSITWQEW